MLEDKRSHGLWELSAPPAPPTSVLSGSISADVVIVGAGYTGLSAALHLAKAGKTAVVLEAIEIGFGASGRNSGFVNAGLWVMPEDLIATLGPVYGNRLIQLLGEAPREVFALAEHYGMRCQADHCGTYHCAVGASGLQQLRARQEQWGRLGAKVELLSEEVTRARTGATGYKGSLFDPRAGTIQPLAYARGLAGAAIGEGATIHTGSAVTSFERGSDGWTVKTAGGSVSANWLILATDAYSAGPTSRIREEQVHLPYFHVSTAPLSHNLRKTILPNGGAGWDTKTILSGFRLDAEGRLIVGSVGALRSTGRGIHRAWAKRHIRKLFPQLGEIEFETEWYGKIGMTPDHLPRLHSYGVNAVGINGYNGRGIAPGTVFGRELARLVLGETNLEGMPLPVSELRVPMFREMREAYYEVGAQLAHLPIVPA
ncbi:MAG TPA: FAD-binding oxidoreductase [Bosea sp. (in: a-proteobacteria)]|jgi:glycine/D-amino acid oxidase-like deaminating enzyme|uniref:NAD(P)/FAD-dependent oxidoreductase n=1 Tax=Bosea sp. (in: a-proteobacteria) TaxID=1871050 RepID=UPI002E13BE2D|nr:FAD-binding oxidoreductase [Bosea sp. (in: a-proteobacteria)]